MTRVIYGTTIGLVIGVFISSANATTTSLAKLENTQGQGNNEIRVTLLGRPCSLQGPFKATALQNIHAIGPDQIYPDIQTSDLELSKKRIQKALGTLRINQNLPDPLFQYREKLKQRLEAQLDMILALIHFRQNQNIADLQKTAEAHLREGTLNSFNALLKKLAPEHGSSANFKQSLIEDIFQLYSDGIEADPEHEFHKATKKLHIQYMCSFE